MGEVTEVAKELERAEVGRPVSGWVANVVTLVGGLITFVELGFVMNYNYTLYNIFGNLGIRVELLSYVPNIQQSMALVLGFVSFLAFILYPITKKVKGENVPPYDWVLGALAAIGPLYMFYYYPQLALVGYPEWNFVNAFFALLTIGLLLEATRRSLGFVLPLIALLFILYATWDANFNLRPLVNHLYYAAEGVFSTPLFVMVTFVFAFLFFGAFVEKIGVGQYITDLMIAAFGRRPAGPAKAAVVSSALVGTISGSSVANVLTTGVFTIPLIKKAGFPPEVAGAVEPAASTGGQIMPPIMGAAAFIMAEFLGRPYRDIIIAAALPALLYFLSVYVFIDREAKVRNIAPMTGDMVGSIRKRLKKVYLLAPIVVITYVLLVGVSPQYAVMASIGSAFVAAVLANERIRSLEKLSLIGMLALISLIPWAMGVTRGTTEEVLAQSLYFGSILTLIMVAVVGTGVHGVAWLKDAVIWTVERTGRSCVGVFLAASSAGLIQGVLTFTGLASTLGEKLVAFSSGNLVLLLLSTMLISLILGMGVPTTANYIITSTIAAPAIMLAAEHVEAVFGAAALALTANMFVFYFGILADVTPPVALASYAGATLARSNFWRTAVNGTKFALAGFLLPFIFVLRPEILLVTVRQWTPDMIWGLFVGLASIILSILLLASSITGWLGSRLKPWLRLPLFVLALASLSTNEYILLTGAITYVLVYLYKRKPAGITASPIAVLKHPA